MTAIEQGNSGRVAGKVALVTGAASGIGRGVALMLAQQGATVCAADMNLVGARETAAQCGNGAWAQELDVTVEAAWQKSMTEIEGKHGRLNVLVQGAGVSSAGPVVEMNFEEWRRVMGVNVDGSMLGLKHTLRLMRARNCEGSIINVSSVAGLRAHAGAGAYGASKAALTFLSKCAALECLRQGLPIRVNSISPAGVRTPLWKTMPFFQELIKKIGGEEQAFRALEGNTPQGKFALVEDVAAAILYLASDESRYVTGTDLVFDHGSTA